MESNKHEKFLKKNSTWVFTTYFTEGFPYIITHHVIPFFLRDMKVSLEMIGLTSLYRLPWILKFLWSPFVDEYGTKKRWLLLLQFLISGIMLLTAIFSSLTFGIKIISIMFFVIAFLSATNDVAIDGYYMEALNKEGQAQYVGLKAMAYRLAMVLGTSGIITIGVYTRWYVAFLFSSIILFNLLMLNAFILSDIETEKKPIKLFIDNIIKIKKIVIILIVALSIIAFRYFTESSFYKNLQSLYPVLKPITFSHWIAIFLLSVLVLLFLFRKKIWDFVLQNPNSHYAKAFISFIDRRNISLILFFIIMLRTGEYMLAQMLPPFVVDLGIKYHYGWLSLFGIPSSIIGAIAGGWAISKYSFKKMIWPFIFAQNFSNLFFMFLATHLSHYISTNTGTDTPIPIGIINLSLIAGTMLFDQFASGLGTAVLMTFLMRLCFNEHKAAHYAIGSGLMVIGGMLAGIASGFIAGSFGYAWTFGISFIISIPAMLIIPLLPVMEDK